MKIKCDKNKEKTVYDIISIFTDEFEMTNDNPDIVVTDHVLYKNKCVSYETNEELKRILYGIFKDVYHKTSPWGILTGSKPQKLYESMPEDEFKRRFLTDDYIINLLRDIKNERKIVTDKKYFNLYVNIPFCPTRCDYCSYPTIVNDKYEELYIDTLLEEVEKLPLNKFHTIYVGGGTPSQLSSRNIKRLVDKLSLFECEEFTFEAGREDSLSYEKLKILDNSKVTRLSLNPQSFNSTVMNKLNRKQDIQKLISYYEDYKDRFIINMDFILGLFEDDFTNNFSFIEKLLPDNITIHTLALKKGSKFLENNKRLNYDKINEEMMKKTDSFLRNLDYSPYYLYRQKKIASNLHNVGYQRENSPSIYNIVINEESEHIIGVGMNANSKFLNGQKLRVSKNMRDYLINFRDIIKTRNEIIENCLKE